MGANMASNFAIGATVYTYRMGRRYVGGMLPVRIVVGTVVGARRNRKGMVHYYLVATTKGVLGRQARNVHATLQAAQANNWYTY